MNRARTPSRPVREHAPNRSYVPIAIKYAVATGAMLVLFMVVLGYSAYRVAGTRVDREINDKGIQLATLAANVIAPFWYGRPAEEDMSASRAQLQKDLHDFIRDSEGVIEVIVYPPAADSFVVSGSGDQSIGFQLEPLAIAAATNKDVTIETGVKGSIPVRSFKRRIVEDGVLKGHVQVILSSAAVSQTLTELQNTTFLIVLGAAIIGVVVAIAIGHYLTRPVRILKSDMLAVASGKLDHTARITSGDELEQLASAFNRMTQHLAEAREQEASRKVLERELSIATNIQTSLLPDRIPILPGYELFPHYASAREVGGDYYDFIPLANGRYGIVVADVSGKGLPGSLVMVMTRSLMRMAARQTLDPAQILVSVNSSLSMDMTRGMFVTLTFVDFDSSSGRLRVVRAGHNPAFLYRAATRKIGAVQPDGIALGMDKGELFNSTLKVQEHRLDAGDFLVLYTDGIVEAMDAEGREYSTERFVKVLAGLGEQSARQIVQGVVKDVEAHTGGGEPSDDITLIVLKRTSVA